MNTFDNDVKEFQTTLNNKLSQEGIDHVFSLLAYITITLSEKKDALKNLQVLSKNCNVDIDVEISKLSTSILNNDGYVFRIQKLGNYLDNEMTKYVVSSIQKFLIDKEKSNLLTGIHKTGFEMTLSLYYPIYEEFYKSNQKPESNKEFDIDYFLNSLQIKNHDPNEIINEFFDEILVEENLNDYEWNFESFDPELNFSKLPYRELARDSPFYIIDENHFGELITKEKFYYEKLSILHKYSDEINIRLEKMSLEDRNDILLTTVMAAYLTIDVNKYSLNTLEWVYKKQENNEFINKLFELFQNRILTDKIIDEILKYIKSKVGYKNSRMICFAMIDIFTVPFIFQNSILKNDNISSKIRNKIQKLQDAIYQIIELIEDSENFHKNEIKTCIKFKDDEGFNEYFNTNHIRLWFLKFK